MRQLWNIAFAALALFLGGTTQAAAQAIPVSPDADPLKERVEITPAERRGPTWLGLVLRSKRDTDPGVAVESVMRRSPADGHDVRPGDRIVDIDGEAVRTFEELRTIVRGHRPGDQVLVGATRDGARHEWKLTLGEMPDSFKVVENHLVGFQGANFPLELMAGKKTDLAGFKGKPTVVDFWATWCGPCHEAQAQLSVLSKRYDGKVHFVGVTAEDRKTVTRHTARYPAPYPLAIDTTGRGHSEYVVNSFPMIVLLDAQQRVAAVFFGLGQLGALDGKLAALLSE